MKFVFKYLVKKKNKDGSYRYYHRRVDKYTRLPADPQSTEFAKEYELAEAPFIESEKVYEGSFGWLCDQYIDTTHFKRLAKATIATSIRSIATITAEPLDPEFDETFSQERLINIKKSHIEVLRDRKEAFPNAANKRIVILNQIFKLAVSRGYIDHNPTRDVENLRITTEGHETATDEHIAQYESYHTHGPAALAMTLLKETGARVSDLRWLGKANIKGDTLKFTTKKTNMPIELPISDTFFSAVNDLNRLIFIESGNNHPFISDKALSARISKWFKQAGIEGITAHSVRKWLATKKAEAGWSEFELMAWFGWKTAKEATLYTQKANRAKLARRAFERDQSGTRTIPKVGRLKKH